ncbi:MAG: hypothetical protein AAGB93_07350 [Planctomycetota bacterium]
MTDLPEIDATPRLVRPLVRPARFVAAAVALCGLAVVGLFVAGAGGLNASLLAADWLRWEGQGLAPLPGVTAPYRIPLHDPPRFFESSGLHDPTPLVAVIGVVLVLGVAAAFVARRRAVGVEPFAVLSSLLAIVAAFGLHVFASRSIVESGWYEPPFVRWRAAPTAAGPLLGLLAAAALFALAAVVRILRRPARTGWVMALCSLVGSTWGIYLLSFLAFAPIHLNHWQGAAIEGLPSIVNGDFPGERHGAELRIVLRGDDDWDVELYPEDAWFSGGLPPDRAWTSGADDLALLDAVAEASAQQVASTGGAPGSPPDPEDASTILAIRADVPFGAVRPVLASLNRLGVEQVYFECAPLAVGGSRSLSPRVYTARLLDRLQGPYWAVSVRLEPPPTAGAATPVVVAGRRFDDMNAAWSSFDETDAGSQVRVDDAVPWRSVVHARDRATRVFVLLD